VSDITIERVSSPVQIDAIMGVELVSFTNPWTREMYLAEFENPDVSFFFLANRGHQVVGFCAFWRILDELHINNVAVLPEARRAGVATTLLERALAEGQALGARRATLEVRRSNTAGLALYAKLGFTVEAVRPGYYTKPDEDALILWKNIEPYHSAS
jgi:ribosomal-protein-alanine N-acetyltransferase